MTDRKKMSMLNFEIEPHVGIGPIKLGMTREQIQAALGEQNQGDSHHGLDYYFDSSIQIEYTNERASFIGASFSEQVSLLYKGQNVFDLSAEELFELISRHEDASYRFDSTEYVFPTQIITLWNADTQYDYLGRERREVWAQVGLGSSEYLAAVS